MPQGSDDSAAGSAGRGLLVTTGLLALLVTGWLAFVAWRREGNLAWDDADYLRRALHNVSRAEARGSLGLVPALIGLTMKERPKPPWLVAWIEVGRVGLGRRDDLRPLIVFATALPFGLTLLGVIVVARWLGGAPAALMAVLVVCASPMALAFGTKVMVETFMALWCLMALAASAWLLQSPTPRRAAVLGLALGLALLTKLTALLLLPLPLLGLVVALRRRHRLDRHAWLRLGLALAIPAMALAGPWYARNGRAAVEFAAWSSRYQEVAEDRSDVLPASDRLAALAGQLAGWPMSVLFGCLVIVGCVEATRRYRLRSSPQPDDPAGDFVRLSLLGVLGGTLVLLRTAYFDPRFLLPIWASVAVSIGVARSRFSTQTLTGPLLRSARIVAFWSLVGMGLATSAAALHREPRNSTFWSTRRLIDELVARYQVATIGNVGNCADWNVCKTGLINELRPGARDCFVLLDVSQWSPEEVTRRLDRLDAVVVLDGSPLSEEVRASAPGLNRGYDPARARLRQGDVFTPVQVAATQGLPNLSVYIRRR
ncbi:MAG: glycosyltransferase family 39 protein [Isosphaeraceae bacterium]